MSAEPLPSPDGTLQAWQRCALRVRGALKLAGHFARCALHPGDSIIDPDYEHVLVYDLPNWLFGLLTIMVTVAIGLGGFTPLGNWCGVFMARDIPITRPLVFTWERFACFTGSRWAYSPLRRGRPTRTWKPGSARKRRRLGRCTETLPVFLPEPYGTSGRFAPVRSPSDRCRIAPTTERDRP